MTKRRPCRLHISGRKMMWFRCDVTMRDVINLCPVYAPGGAGPQISENGGTLCRPNVPHFYELLKNAEVFECNFSLAKQVCGLCVSEPL